MPRDKLDRYYTPDALAMACVAALTEEGGDRILSALEPSCGGGAFVRAPQSAGCPPPLLSGCDVDNKAIGLRELAPRRRQEAA